MKYIKYFESTIKEELQIGDYIICKITALIPKMSEFISNNIGQIVDIRKPTNFNNIIIQVKYINIPKELQKFFMKNTYDVFKKDILMSAKTIEELETKIKSNKFNL